MGDCCAEVGEDSEGKREKEQERGGVLGPV